MSDKKNKKKDLESAIKEKVSPLLEEVMEKKLGVTIPKLETDITDKLANPHLNIYVPLDLGFKQAKKLFKKEFIKKELNLHLGNISQLAKVLGIDRRSVHRAIKDLEIEVVKSRGELVNNFYQDMIDKTIRSTLDQYKGIIHPHKMEDIYQEVPDLSRNIAQFLPHKDLTWKEAEKEFEKQFLSQSLNDNKGNVSATAKFIGLRAETLHRKLKKLGLKS